MNIISDYQLNYFNNSVKRNNNLPLQTNPNFGNKQKIITKGLKPVVENIATVGAGTVLALQTGKALQGNVESQKVQTNYGPVVYLPAKGKGTKSKLEVSRPNGMTMDIFEGIPQEILESPVSEHLHQFKSSTINPNVGIVLVQNQSKPVTARKVVIEGSLENSMVKNNMTNIPVKYSAEQDSMYTDTPWNPGIQYANQRCFQVTYGTVKEDWGARPEYIAEYANPQTGEAPDVAILAAQKGSEDRSFVPADIAGAQYEIVTESGDRTPCDYENMTEGVDYKISKKAGVELKMAVPPTDVISSEGEVLEAGNLYMVDSMGHFYNGQPIKRIKSGEVTWNADMNDMEQKTIRILIDESLECEADAKDAKKAGAIDLAAVLTIKAKELTQLAEVAMKNWVLSAQNKDGVDFFAAEL
ncbi:MAG: hypothetical protein E7Z89_07540 [Cyanobacteria bacterium SIG28]|nr:hypothetical protein [Cyanobacteria bacterium SIG28]